MATGIDLPRRRRLYLVRHGDVSYFDEAGTPIPPNTVSLNAEGRAQAEATALFFATIPLDAVFTSDLPRTVETAQHILRVLPAALSIQQRPELREVQPGSFRELPAAGVRAAFLGALGEVTPNSRFLGGEAMGDFYERVWGCLQEVFRDPTWRHLLIVAHGGVNRVLLTHALGTGLAGFGRVEQDPCCINVLDVDEEGNWLVRLVNHTVYNPAKIGMELTTMEKIYREFLRGSANR